MELWCRQMTYHSVPWNSMEHSMEFHGTLVPPNEVSLSSMELWDCHFMTCYPGLSRTIPRNSTEFWSRQLKNHKKHRVPWDSMELGGRHYKWHKCSKEFHGIFHGTLVPPNDKSLSSMEFHGIFHGTLVTPNDISISSMEFHGIFHGIPWNFGAAKWSIT